MLKLKRYIAVVALVVCATIAKADNLWIIGEALPYGWNLDQATALLSKPGDETIFTGTVYLTADKEFKFMTYPEWGSKEYGGAPDATMIEGEIMLTAGSNDEGYLKLKVAESGNYFIKVDTVNLVATFEKSPYQDIEIKLASLYMVGSATLNNWDVMNGMPLYQNYDSPFLFGSEKAQLKEGTFKIATTLKGANSWNGDYWYFRNAEDDKKIALNQEGDLQWSISEDGSYTIAVNIEAESIDISKYTTTGIENLLDDDTTNETTYYTLTGVKVDNPQTGIFIKKIGSEVTKIFIK